MTDADAAPAAPTATAPTADPAEWLTAPAARQGRAIASGRVDPRDLTEAYLAAIDAHPESDRIYARTTPERARAEAAAASERAKSGMLRGPLDGVAISWKDLFDTAGVATEGGTRMLQGRVPEHDAVVLARAAEAGTICLGKTHTTELAFSGLGVNPMTATPPNAIDPPKAPGGSSSGAAVSTRLGLAAAGIGSDTGGSVRIPAAWNDLVGLKTTAGKVPTTGVIALSRTFDTVGPLCRTVEDAALLYAIMANLPTPHWGGADIHEQPVFVAETVVLDGCDPGIVEAFEEVIGHLAKAGLPVGRGPVPEFQGIYDAMATLSPLVTTEAWGEWGEVIAQNPDTMWPPIEARFRQGQDPDHHKDALSSAEMHRHSVALQERMATAGLIAMPTTPIWPPETERLLSDPDFFTERNLLALRNTRLANLMGVSSITLPTPTPMLGLMLFAPPGQEEILLRTGRAIERIFA